VASMLMSLEMVVVKNKGEIFTYGIIDQLHKQFTFGLAVSLTACRADTF
jgi:hypothetical protein